MRWVVWVAIGVGCAGAGPDGVGPADTDSVVHTGLAKPHCGDLGEGCDALPARRASWTCGPAFFADGDLSTPVWPSTLTATGCFTGLDPLTPVADVAPYAVRAPLWSEGADKARWMALPPGEQVTMTAAGEWRFPDGAVLLKSFSLRRVDAEPASARLLEVRVMVRAGGAWSFGTYMLDDARTEGTLLADQGRYRTFEVQAAQGPVDVTWWYPGPSGCAICHRDTAQVALGTATLQLNRPVDYGDVIANQLVALEAAGWLQGTPATLQGLPTMVSPYQARTAPEARARAWLHGQCAHCHEPGGFVPPDLPLDLRHDTPLADMHACNVRGLPTITTPAELILAPGHAADSLLVQRARVDGVDRMPAGTVRLDEAGLAAVQGWIDGLAGCR